jgi:predicted nucleic acid-binding protein
MAFYLDTSAAVKLVVEEVGSAALRSWLADGDPVVVSSDLLRTELLRAVRRGAPDQVFQARAVLDAVTLMTVSTSVFERAVTLEPAGMRSLEALHLASALELGDDLEGIVTYDERLTEAVAMIGYPVVAPA